MAERQEVSLSYLEQLIARLKSKGLVKSMRGPGGGYLLGTGGDQITIYEVVRAVDEPEPRVRVDDPLTASGRQLSDQLWQAIGDEIDRFLKSVSLADVCNCCLTDPVHEIQKSFSEIHAIDEKNKPDEGHSVYDVA